MDCNVIKDLIPLYIDGCCSPESADLVRAHIGGCEECRSLWETMKQGPETAPSAPAAPKRMGRIREWKASVLQSALLFASFLAIIVGVAREAATPHGDYNGFWAIALIIPATAFLLSMANWYFVRLYRSRRRFSNGCVLALLAFALCGFAWAFVHYQLSIPALLKPDDASLSITFALLIGMALTAVFCILSKVLSNLFAKMVGKE